MTYTLFGTKTFTEEAIHTLSFTSELEEGIDGSSTKMTHLQGVDGSPVLLQTPTLNMQLTTDGKAFLSEVEGSTEFSDALRAWDQFNVATTLSMCEQWFKRPIDAEVIDKRYRPLVTSGDVEVCMTGREQVYDSLNTPMDPIAPGEHWVELVMHLKGIEFHPRVMQPKVQVLQVRVVPAPEPVVAPEPIKPTRDVILTEPLFTQHN